MNPMSDPSPAQSPAQSPVSRNRWRIHLLLITAYILVVGLLGLSRKGGAREAALSHTAAGLLGRCAVELLVFGLVFGLAWLASRATRGQLRLGWRGVARPVLQGIGYSVALRLALGVLMVMIALGLVATQAMSPKELQNFFAANRPDVRATVDLAALRDDPAYFWLTVTLVSFVVAGLREELWRSAFLAGLQALWPRWFGSTGGQVLAVILCAMLFGLGHMAMGWVAVGMTGMIGLGLGLIMVLHRSIWPAVIAHGLFDATSFAMLPWAMKYAGAL